MKCDFFVVILSFVEVDFESFLKLQLINMFKDKSS